MSAGPLANRIVLVSGVGPGLGRAVANAVVFFLSDLSAKVTGQILYVEAGSDLG